MAESSWIGGQDQFAEWITPRLMFDCREFFAWAAPMYYGPWYLIAQHIGVVNYTGEVWSEGETALFGRIRYYCEDSWPPSSFVVRCQVKTILLPVETDSWAAEGVWDRGILSLLEREDLRFSLGPRDDAIECEEGICRLGPRAGGGIISISSPSTWPDSAAVMVRIEHPADQSGRGVGSFIARFDWIVILDLGDPMPKVIRHSLVGVT